MEAQPYATVTNGTHKGKMGYIVSKTDHYTKVRISDDTIIRCKNAFVVVQDQEVVLDDQDDLEEVSYEPYDPYDDLLQEPMPLQPLPLLQGQPLPLMQEQDYKAHSAMIQDQNYEYEMSLKQDLQAHAQAQAQAQALALALALAEPEPEAEPEPIFEEVSAEEMRRVRLLRFG